MLGRVQRVSVAGEQNDENSANRVLIDDNEKRRTTDEMLLAAAEIDYQEEIIRQREAGINSIQREVHLVHELFQDVAIHVSNQGQTLDHIEANVTSARDRTREANEQLIMANRRGGGTRQNLLCFVLIAISIIILLAMIKSLTKPNYVASIVASSINSSIDGIFQI